MSNTGRGAGNVIAMLIELGKCSGYFYSIELLILLIFTCSVFPAAMGNCRWRDNCARSSLGGGS